MADAMASGHQSPSEAQADWLASAKLCTLSEAVAHELLAHNMVAEASHWEADSALKSHDEVKALARSTLKGPGLEALETWCSEKARTKEGWYRTAPGVEVRARLIAQLRPC